MVRLKFFKWSMLFCVLHFLPANSEPRVAKLFICDSTSSTLLDAYILKKGTNQFFFSDESGQITLTQENNDTLVAQCLGYKSQVFFNLFKTPSADTIFLQLETFLLNEVQVLDENEFASVIIGNNKPKLGCSYHGRVRSAARNDEMGLQISNSKIGYLKDMNVYVAPRSVIGSKFRVKIYEDLESAGSPIYIGEVQEVLCQDCWFKVDFTGVWPKVNGDFLIVVEWLFSTKEVKSFVQDRVPAGFAIGLSKNSQLEGCRTKSVLKDDRWYSTCCGTEDDKYSLNAMIWSELLVKK